MPWPTRCRMADASGRFVQILTRTVGSRARLQSRDSPQLATEVNRLQSVIVPAAGR